MAIIENSCLLLYAENMPSAISVLLREEIRLVKPIINKLTIATARAFQDALGEMEAKHVASKVAFEDICMGDFEACMASPKKGAKDGRVILYLHGGGYVAGNLKYARGFAGILAIQTGTRVFSAAYRLAPENPFPAAVEDALAAYRYLLDEGFGADRISFVGESAGGGLIYALCLRIRQAGLPLPCALVGISPWTDLTFTGSSYQTNCAKDPSLTEDALRVYAAAYATGQEINPLVSPIYGDLRDMPPSLLFAGGDELLLDDAGMLADRLIASGSRCELIVAEGLWHVYVLFKIPEANKALNRIASFLEHEYERRRVQQP